MVDVKETFSKHLVSLDRRGWRSPDLDPSVLNELLRRLIEDDEIPVVIGKKRHAADADSHTAPSKRQKLTDVTNGTPARASSGEEVDHKVPAFKHTYEIVFTLSPTDSDKRNTNTTEGYRKEVEALKKTLSLCSESSTISDRGDITLPVTVRSYFLNDASRYTLDVCHADFDDPFLSFSVNHTTEVRVSGDGHPPNPIGAAHFLRAYHAVDITFSVRLRPNLDPDHSQGHALPLKISIDMEASLCFPQITHAQKNVNRRVYADAWNALVKHLFPPPSADPPNYRGETDIAFLYSILEPAPPLPLSVSPASVQPEELAPTLLPFQRRSVLWMLQREGKTLDEEGKVVPFAQDYLPLFWETLELGGQTVHLNRLRETLSLEAPTSDIEHPGGSLNEAPGLGKTVECLALILLNPDIWRNPSVKRWDLEAEVHVREVHVSGYMLSARILGMFLILRALGRRHLLSRLLLWLHNGKTS